MTTWVLAVTLAVASSSVESPDRDTLFDLDPPIAAATGAGIAGGTMLAGALTGALLVVVNPAFVLVPLVTTVALPLAAGVGAVWGANLSDSALSVGLGTGGGVVAGGLLGAVVGLVGGSIVSDDAAFVAAWAGGMIGGSAGGAGTAALLTMWNE